jgi:small subunit ribosomal protein S20
MAHHLSAKKRIRQTEKRNLLNRYFARTTRNAIKNLRSTKEKDAATEMLPQVSSMIDKLARKNIIHRNKAANLKSKLTHHVNSL